jgi:hypothetical protein
MTTLTSAFSKAFYALLMGAGLLLGTTGMASAYVVCNDEGDCWHTDHREHHPGIHFIIHTDDWYFHHDWDNDHDRRWRQYHEGHGYWHSGVWVQL